MSQENVEIIRSWFEPFAASGEVDFSILHSDVEIYDHDLPDSRFHQGHDGFARWTEEWASAWDEYALTPEDYIDAGDRVVGVHRTTATGKASGITLDRQDAVIYTLRDGKIIRLDYFNNKPEALEAAGLSE